MRHRLIAVIITVAAVLAAIPSLGEPISAQAADVPLANSLNVESILLIGGWPSAAPLIPVVGDGHAQLAYELYLTNFGRQPVRIVSLEIRGAGGAPFETTVEGKALRSSYTPAAPKSRLEAYDPILPPGASGMLFVFLKFPGRTTPARLENSIVAEADGDPKSIQRVLLGAAAVQKPDAAPLDQPLTGGDWLAANGPSNTSIHRRAVIVIDGRPRVPERYAIDFIRLGSDGQSYTGDQHKNTSYHAYNAPILAVADGRIVEARDGFPENVPHTDKRAVALTLESMAGNNIVEDIGAARYVGYAHLIPGSLTVKAGDRVHRGQVLGRLGNSGNSTEPHLHLQVCNAPSFLACDGLPMEFRRMSLTAYRLEKRGDTPVKLIRQGSRDASGEEPMEDELVSFAPAAPPPK